MSTLKGGSEAQILIKMATLAKPINSRKSYKRGKLTLVYLLGGIKIEKNRVKKFESWLGLCVVPCPRISPVILKGF